MNDDPGGVSSCDDTDDASAPFAVGTAEVRATDRAVWDTDDGRGAYVADMTIRAVLDGTDGGRYRYHLHVIEVVDGQGRVRHADSDHQRLIELP